MIAVDEARKTNKELLACQEGPVMIAWTSKIKRTTVGIVKRSHGRQELADISISGLDAGCVVNGPASLMGKRRCGYELRHGHNRCNYPRHGYLAGGYVEGYTPMIIFFDSRPRSVLKAWWDDVIGFEEKAEIKTPLIIYEN